VAVTTLTREDLIALCERGAVAVNKWRDRDSEMAQRQLGEAWALLRANCEFVIDEKMTKDARGKTIWVVINRPGFATVDWDGPWKSDHYYLPTSEHLDAVDGNDWYC
jgi:hypothetical protein